MSVSLQVRPEEKLAIRGTGVFWPAAREGVMWRCWSVSGSVPATGVAAAEAAVLHRTEVNRNT